MRPLSCTHLLPSELLHRESIEFELGELEDGRGLEACVLDLPCAEAGRLELRGAETDDLEGLGAEAAFLELRA